MITIYHTILKSANSRARIIGGLHAIALGMPRVGASNERLSPLRRARDNGRMFAKSPCGLMPAGLQNLQSDRGRIVRLHRSFEDAAESTVGSAQFRRTYCGARPCALYCTPVPSCFLQAARPMIRPTPIPPPPILWPAGRAAALTTSCQADACLPADAPQPVIVSRLTTFGGQTHLWHTASRVGGNRMKCQ